MSFGTEFHVDINKSLIVEITFPEKKEDYELFWSEDERTYMFNLGYRYEPEENKKPWSWVITTYGISFIIFLLIIGSAGPIGA